MPARIPIGLQLYSVREECQKDLGATLEAVADMGYACVETAGLYDVPVATWTSLLRDTNLGVAGAHVPLPSVTPENLTATIDRYAALGCRTLVVPALPGEYRETIDGYKRAAAIISEAAAKGPEGVRLGYHNHAFEFEPIDGQVPYDAMLDVFGDEVLLQFDFGWLYRAGQDGAAMVMAHPGRQQTVHIKAYKADEETAVVGADEVPWQDVFAACESVGNTEVYIVEHERYADEPLVCVKQCIDNLRAMGK